MTRAPEPAGLPPARDPRMDRRRDAHDDGWLLVMVPRDAARAVERVELRSRELGAWKLAAGLLGLAVIAALVLLAFSWPRSQAYGALVGENLELKRRLDEIDRKMGEVDRVLLRLRLYDAQLESLGGPRGDHGGPLPEAIVANRALLSDVIASGSDEEESGFRAPASWADEIEQRAEAFLETSRRVEPLLNRLVSERVSLEALDEALPKLWPARGRLTSGYGWRRNPFGGRWKHHSGVDIGGRRGEPILAAADGVVLSAGWSGGLGRAVVVDHGFGITTVYGHCSALDVTAGQEVRRGDRIAAMGTTGHSTGPHLHFEVRIDGHPVDPLDYVTAPPEALRPSGSTEP